MRNGPPWPHWCTACRRDTFLVRGDDGIERCPGPHPDLPPEHLRLDEAGRRARARPVPEEGRR